MYRAVPMSFSFCCFLFCAASIQAAAFIPPGLTAGDIYHVAFYTSGSRNATSSEISDYNDFVNAQAALNPFLTGTDVGVKYSAIASTESIDARDNAFVSAPIYRFDGVRVADSFIELWGGNPAAPIFVDQFGAVAPELSPFGPFAWTGTASSGEGADSRELGSISGVSRSGHPPGPLAAGSLWLSAGDATQGNQAHLFALSGPLNFQGLPIPEPTTLTLAAFSLLAIAFSSRSRSRR